MNSSAPRRRRSDRLGRAGAARGGEVVLGGVGAAAHVGERVAEADQHLAPLLLRPVAERQRVAVVRDGAVEGQRLGGAPRRRREVDRRAIGVPGLAPVAAGAQRVAAVLEGLGQLLVQLARLGAGGRLARHLPDAIVREVDQLVAALGDRVDEARRRAARRTGASPSWSRRARRGAAASARASARPRSPACAAPAPRLGKGLDLRAQHAVEREGRAVAAPQVRRARQLEEKQRVPGRLARQHLGVALRIAGAAARRADRAPAPAPRRRPRLASASCCLGDVGRQEAPCASGRRGRAFAASRAAAGAARPAGAAPPTAAPASRRRPTADRRCRRRWRPARRARAEAGGRRRTSRRAPRAGRGRRAGGGACAMSGMRPSTGKACSSTAARSGTMPRERLGVDLPQEAGEHVDQTVDRLEGDQLALVAAGGEHDRRRMLGSLQPRREERAHQRRLPDARFAAHDEDARAPAPPHLGERRLERVELALAADEADRLVGRAGRSTERAGRRRRQRRQHLEGRGAPLGVASSAAGRRAPPDPVRHLGGQRGDARRAPVLLAVEDLVRQPLERQPPGEQLEQDDAEGVPVGRGVHRLHRHLLGRHVLGRPRPRLRRLDRRRARPGRSRAARRAPRR